MTKKRKRRKPEQTREAALETRGDARSRLSLQNVRLLWCSVDGTEDVHSTRIGYPKTYPIYQNTEEP